MGTPVPARALYIWGERPDLQAAFDLKRRAGREGLIWWYLRHGFAEYGLPPDGNDRRCINAVNRSYPRAKPLSYLPITWLMQGFIDRSPVDRQSALRDPAGQQRFLDWFFAIGLIKANLADFLSADQAVALVLEADPQASGLPRLMKCIWSSEPKIRARFNGLADPAFRAWCSGDGAREFPILAHPAIALAPKPDRLSHKLKPFGVNLLGHASGRSGISEDVRMAAKVLTHAGIPFALHDISPGAAMPDEEHTEASSECLTYAINLFCMSAPSTVATAFQIGPHVITDCYNIGFWPWELPEMPDFWLHSYNFVDEVWASSRFTHEAFCRSSPRPVRHMPFAVSAAESDQKNRTDFGLPSDKFLFGFAFDGLSGFARKAPLATIQAFKAAFPTNTSVGLVIKGMRVFDDPAWNEVISAVGHDQRIHFITQSLPRGSLLDLWRSLDCFVSLHRSEGFGRNVAETMLLGKPVIVTGYSGNMDFTRHDTAALVPYTLRAVANGEYPFSSGQIWAEPDIFIAAATMQKIAIDSEFRETLSQTGRQNVDKLYNFDHIAESWSIIINTIYNDQK
ncbi:glycosyltransferase involved in cell wall biosynthesis [Novosphingobium sp. PhB165]|nr:glycosyltransferase involved in cell wall biosynthesis [Novosphingobium sp. PhB165]